MSFAYLVTDPNGPTTCDEVGAVKLEIISTHLLTSQETVQLGPCNAPGTAQTVVLPSGPYGNQLSLIGQFDNVISTQPTNTGVVNDDGSNTFLGTFTFAF